MSEGRRALHVKLNWRKEGRPQSFTTLPRVVRQISLLEGRAAVRVLEIVTLLSQVRRVGQRLFETRSGTVSS